MLEEITTLAIFHFFLIFCRVGSAMMFMPGFGEIYVSPRVRLSIALLISLIMLPALEGVLPKILPSGGLALFIAIFPEIIVGLFIGALTRMLQAVLHIAGIIIAFQSSLASAMLFDANQGSQGSVIGNFMTLTGLTLLFVTDMHHLMIIGLIESYSVFIAGNFPPMNDFAEFLSTTLAAGFMVAMKISAPLIVVGLCLYLAAGIMGRLMPNMQVFFVMIPVQLYISFIMLALTLTAGMMLYLEFFKEILMKFFSP